MKLMILRPGALGDTLMLLPSLLALPVGTEVTFVGRQPGLEFMRPHVKSAMDMERHGWHGLFMDGRDTIRLPVSGADLTVAFFRDEDGVINRNLQSVLPKGSVFVFPSLPPREEPIHVAYYIALCLKKSGLPVDPENALNEIKQVLDRRGGTGKTFRNKMVFHPGSGSREKNHSGDFWLDLLGFAKKDSRLGRLESIILLGPAEKNLVAFLGNSPLTSDSRILFCPDKEVLLPLLGETAVYIGHDSGVTHLSAMGGTPTIALFRKTDPIQWAPLGPYVDIINGRKTSGEVIERTLASARKFIEFCHSSSFAEGSFASVRGGKKRIKPVSPER